MARKKGSKDKKKRKSYRNRYIAAGLIGSGVGGLIVAKKYKDNQIDFDESTVNVDEMINKTRDDLKNTSQNIVDQLNEAIKDSAKAYESKKPVDSLAALELAGKKADKSKIITARRSKLLNESVPAFLSSRGLKKVHKIRSRNLDPRNFKITPAKTWTLLHNSDPRNLDKISKKRYSKLIKAVVNSGFRHSNQDFANFMKFTLVKGKRKTFLRKVLGVSAGEDRLYDISKINSKLNKVKGLQSSMSRPMDIGRARDLITGSREVLEEKGLYSGSKPFEIYPNMDSRTDLNNIELRNIMKGSGDMLSSLGMDIAYDNTSPANKFKKLHNIKRKLQASRARINRSVYRD